MTLKIHVIYDHLEDYFECTGETLKYQNGEFIESKHSKLRMAEENHGFKVKRKLATPVHLDNALRSIVFQNSKHSGEIPANMMRLRKYSSSSSSSNSSTPSSSPRKGYKFSKMYLDTIGE